jgi:hypothetical protein
MPTNPSPDLIKLDSPFNQAVKKFENGQGANSTQLTNELKNCESADDVIRILEDKLQEQKEAFRNFRGDDDKLMTYLKRTVHVLHSLSTGGVLVGGSTWCIYLYAFSRPTSVHRVTPTLFSAPELPTSNCNFRWNGCTSWRMRPI